MQYAQFDNSLCFILDMMLRFVPPSESRSMGINYGVATQGANRSLGGMKGQKFIADGHDSENTTKKQGNRSELPVIPCFMAAIGFVKLNV